MNFTNLRILIQFFIILLQIIVQSENNDLYIIILCYTVYIPFFIIIFTGGILR